MGTVRAQTGELEIVAYDFENRGAVKLIFNLVQGGDGCIVHPVALNATDMVVLAADAIVPFQGSAEFEFLNFT